jgi:hypothetical protein
MAGSSSITLFEKSSPHHSLYIASLHFFSLRMKDEIKTTWLKPEVKALSYAE